MKKSIIIFSIIGLFIFAYFPIMEQYISFEETAGYCDNCFRPFWENISEKGWIIFFAYSFSGICFGSLIGFLYYKIYTYFNK